MKEDMKILKCGGCGESKVNLYISEAGEILAECTKCERETKLTINKPVISLEWGDNGNGVLCVF